MPRPSIYLDECVRVRLALRLRLRGFDVTTARDQGMDGASDAQQLAYATGREAMIVTYDSQHFRLLHLHIRPHGGIIILPDSSLDWQEIRAAMLVDWIVASGDYRSRLFRWHDLQQHLIGGARLPDYSEDDVRRALGQIP